MTDAKKPKSSFQLDVLLEQSVARFMDDYFYSKLSEKSGIPCRRMYDKSAQTLGIDTTIGKFCIDEKVKIKGGYISKILEYPSFEISFKSHLNGKINDGWFVKDGLKTDYYAFITVFSNETDWKLIRYGNIDRLVVLFVHKKTLVESLCGNTRELKAMSDELRRTCCINDRLDIGDGHLKISMQFPEEPVNLVMRRDVLMRLPHTREIEVNKKFFMELI